MLVSVTRLKVRRALHLPAFYVRTYASMRQARRTAGFLGGAVGRARDGSYWTLTGWAREEDMRAFRNGGAHQKAMRRLPVWCDEAQYAHWEADALPGWDEAERRLRDAPRFSKVRRPSADHEAGRIPPTGGIDGTTLAPRTQR